MQVEQRRWTEATDWTVTHAAPGMRPAQLVLLFGAREALGNDTALSTLRAAYAQAQLIGCSTAGEICGTDVLEGSLVATAIYFEHTQLRTACRALTDARASEAAGEQLAADLPAEGLVHVFVLAEGVKVNGSELVNGLRRGLPSHVAVTGGLAGDGEAFQQTTVYFDGRPREGAVAVVGLYGAQLRVGYGSMGGWEQFGPERRITRSEGNVLYELDGGSALELYKTYLGSHARDLPASGLLFPLSLQGEQEGHRVVRTILGVDEPSGSLTFAGDVPHGASVRLMRATVDRLINGAHGAAGASYDALGREAPDLAILISCVGRKLVLKQRVEEEVESVRDVMGDATVLSGFYSYGEIAPFAPSVKCELHNQTMTITTLAER